MLGDVVSHLVTNHRTVYAGRPVVHAAVDPCVDDSFNDVLRV